jgi:hypothetical protein
VRNVHSRPQHEPQKEAAPSHTGSLWLKTPWLENRQLAHPRFTSDEESPKNVRVGITWFVDDAESFVSSFSSACRFVSEINLKGCLAKGTILRLTAFDAVTKNPEDVLLQLPEFTVKESHCIRNVIILATPSLAHVLERKDFLQSIVARIYTTSEMPTSQESRLPELDLEIRSLATIVDALPYGETTVAPQHDSEGLSILFSSGSINGEPALPGSVGDDDTNYTLSFISRKSPNTLLPSIQGHQPMAIRYMTLPVANTFFVNGNRATIFEDVWKVSFSSSSTTSDQEQGRFVPNISHEKRQDLRTATIEAGFQGTDLGRCELPLTPLTMPRNITKAMGNVVTEIQLPERTVPASTELESSVSRYLSVNPQAASAGPLLIYASVRPPISGTSPVVETLPQDRLHSISLIDTFKGCTRLFRVTGGGGGWGKKQGLLSLDPAVDFDGEGVISSFPHIGDVDDIGQVFEPKGMMPLGSTIQFWVWEKSNKQRDDHFPDPDPKHAKQNLRQVLDRVNKMHFVLGTGPRAEEREGIEGQGRLVLSKSRVRQCLYGYFGMLTYGGAAVGSVETLGQSQPTAGPPALYAGARSRVDVPNTTFVLDVGLD